KGNDMTTNENFKELLKFIDERLQKKHNPELELVRKHNAEAMNKDWKIPEDGLWEQSDVIHDFLAFLAEQMIEMNKEKQNESKGFLDWFEGYCKVKIDELTSRTKLREYYKYGWGEIKDILVRNKKKIIEFDITRREPLEKIRAEYEPSIKKLMPLLQKIEDTDTLIDQIVYKLYGLTEEEIKIVEGSIGKK
ncbi:MAG: hypothetical protein KKB04_03525, partial [Candidatus Thermoplasmatota archaeon]|nr:hypothetical protein [Candidatus Thermoplasmatota archaeon]